MHYFKFEQCRQNTFLAYETIISFNDDLIQYQQASKAIVAIFHYLVSDSVYVAKF